MEEMCRLCGSFNKSENLKIHLDDIFGQIQFKHLVSYYCRYDLPEHASLPQKVCSSCVELLQSFILFSHRMEIVQKQLNATSEDKEKESTASSEIEQSLDESLLVPVETPKKAKKRGRKPNQTRIENPVFYRFFNMFKQEMANPLPSYAQLNTHDSEVAPDGEVKMEGVKLWRDFFYCCTHCKIKYESLDNLFKHFRADVPFSQGGKTWLIKCTDCWGVFSRPQYMNHVQKHHPHLKFTCINCSKIYKNMGCLLNHYMSEHSSSVHAIYFCVNCGEYFTDIQALRLHKLSHDSSAERTSATRLMKDKLKKQSKRQKASITPLGESANNRMATRRNSILETPSQAKKLKTKQLNKPSPLSKKSLEASEKITEKPRACPLSKKPKPARSSDITKEPEKNLIETRRSMPCPLSRKSQSVELAQPKVQESGGSKPSSLNMKPQSDDVAQPNQGSPEPSKPKPCPLSKKTPTKEIPSDGDAQETVKKKPCPLSRRTTDLTAFEELHEMFIKADPLSDTQVEPVKAEDSLDTNQNKLHQTHLEEHLNKLKNQSLIADFLLQGEWFAVQKVVDGPWNWVQNAENLEIMIKPSEEEQNDSVNHSEFPEIGKRIMKRRLTCH